MWFIMIVLIVASLVWLSRGKGEMYQDDTGIRQDVSREVINTKPLQTNNMETSQGMNDLKFNSKIYKKVFVFPDQKKSDFTSESYEWTTDGEHVDSWTTLITTHKMKPLSKEVPLLAEAYAQNVAAMNVEKGAVLFETSVINTPDALAAGVDPNHPPFLLAYAFLSQDKSVPSEVSIQKIESDGGDGLNAFIYSEKVRIYNQDDVKTFTSSKSYADVRWQVVLRKFPY